ncbi:hypothetical protein BGZ92_008660 [Podila epicladia]|nr:hypothetical protein BGZ92_008660 [Podila epicladia]
MAEEFLEQVIFYMHQAIPAAILPANNGLVHPHNSSATVNPTHTVHTVRHSRPSRLINSSSPIRSILGKRSGQTICKSNLIKKSKWTKEMVKMAKKEAVEQALEKMNRMDVDDFDVVMTTPPPSPSLRALPNLSVGSTNHNSNNLGPAGVTLLTAPMAAAGQPMAVATTQPTAPTAPMTATAAQPTAPIAPMTAAATQSMAPVMHMVAVAQPVIATTQSMTAAAQVMVGTSIAPMATATTTAATTTFMAPAAPTQPTQPKAPTAFMAPTASMAQCQVIHAAPGHASVSTVPSTTTGKTSVSTSSVLATPATVQIPTALAAATPQPTTKQNAAHSLVGGLGGSQSLGGLNGSTSGVSARSGLPVATTLAGAGPAASRAATARVARRSRVLQPSTQNPNGSATSAGAIGILSEADKKYIRDNSTEVELRTREMNSNTAALDLKKKNEALAYEAEQKEIEEKLERGKQVVKETATSSAGDRAKWGEVRYDHEGEPIRTAKDYRKGKQTRKINDLRKKGNGKGKANKENRT